MIFTKIIDKIKKFSGSLTGVASADWGLSVSQESNYVKIIDIIIAMSELGESQPK